MHHIKILLFFLLASSFGAFLRFAIMESLALLQSKNVLLWGVFLANLLGCFLFGVFWIFTKEKTWNAHIVLVGFLGSLTTFSAYIYDLYTFIQNKNYFLLLTNSLAQIFFGILLLRLGLRSGSRLLQLKIVDKLR